MPRLGDNGSLGLKKFVIHLDWFQVKKVRQSKIVFAFVPKCTQIEKGSERRKSERRKSKKNIKSPKNLKRIRTSKVKLDF